MHGLSSLLPSNPELTARQLWQLVRSTGAAFVDDHAASMGAAPACFTLFSLAPRLLITVAVAGLCVRR